MKIVGEAGPGELVGEDVVTIEREELITPASIGLTIAEGEGHPGKPATTNRSGPGGTSRSDYPVLFGMRQEVSHEGLLPIESPKRLRDGAYARSTPERMFLYGFAGSQLFHDLHESVSNHARTAVSDR